MLLENRGLLVLPGNQDQLDQKDQKVSRTNDIEIKGKTEAFITAVVNVGKRGKETPLLTDTNIYMLATWLAVNKSSINRISDNILFLFMVFLGLLQAGHFSTVICLIYNRQNPIGKNSLITALILSQMM